MRLAIPAAPALLALALAACSNGSDTADQLSTEANFSDADVNAALGGGPPYPKKEAIENSTVNAQ